MNKSLIKVMIILTIILGIEVSARIYYARIDKRNDFVEDKLVKKSNVPGVRYELNPGEYPYSADTNIPLKINSIGFRCEEISKAAKTKILVLGDSIIFARYLNYNDTGVSILERLLKNNSGRDDIQVINGGLSGRNTSEEVSLLENIYDKVKPSIVILGICVNDFVQVDVNLIESKNNKGTKSFFVKAIKDWLGSKESIRIFKRGLTKRILGKNADLIYVKLLKSLLNQSEVKWNEWSLEFQKIKDFCDKKGCNLILTIFPSEPQAYPIPDILEMSQSYESSHKILPIFCKERNIPLIDLLEEYRSFNKRTGKRVYLPNDFLHPNEIGQKIWAEEVASYLKNKI